MIYQTKLTDPLNSKKKLSVKVMNRPVSRTSQTGGFPNFEALYCSLNRPVSRTSQTGGFPNFEALYCSLNKVGST